MGFGQSCGVHIHDTLLNALFRAIEFVKKSGGIVGEAQSRKLPAMVRIKEVAIGNTAMSVGSCKRGAAQHQLVDHELAVVLAERALDGAVTGIGGVGAAGPLPDNPERVVELAGTGGDFPFHFGRQMPAAPARKRIGLVIADMADRADGSTGFNPPSVMIRHSPST